MSTNTISPNRLAYGQVKVGDLPETETNNFRWQPNGVGSHPSTQPARLPDQLHYSTAVYNLVKRNRLNYNKLKPH
ncbi:MAG: hypothetical protein JXM69_16690 [Anaerolineae bacterium]|nr:hypothetical protein [Anaerolineae bacterium]